MKLLYRIRSWIIKEMKFFNILKSRNGHPYFYKKNSDGEYIVYFSNEFGVDVKVKDKDRGFLDLKFEREDLCKIKCEHLNNIYG